MEAIKDTLNDLMQGLKVRRQKSIQADPEGLLKKLLTKKELTHIKIGSLRRGTLRVNVDSSSWLYRLSLEKENLLEKISKEYPAIKEIRFFLGETR